MTPQDIIGPPSLGAVLAAFGVLITAAGSLYAAIRAARTNREATAVQFNTNLISRVTKIESDLKEVTEKQRVSERVIAAAVRFIDKLVDWGKDGGGANIPAPPPELHDYFDPAEFQQRGKDTP